MISRPGGAASRTAAPPRGQSATVVGVALLTVVGASGPGCGVERYRQARPSASLAVRFVAEGAEASADAELLERWDGSSPLAVERAVVLGAEHIEHVQLLETGEGPRVIVLDLSDVGRERLREATTARAGARLAIVAGGRVVAAPTIREPLTEGEAYVRVEAAHVERAYAALAAPSE